MALFCWLCARVCRASTCPGGHFAYVTSSCALSDKTVCFDFCAQVSRGWRQFSKEKKVSMATRQGWHTQIGSCKKLLFQRQGKFYWPSCQTISWSHPAKLRQNQVSSYLSSSSGVDPYAGIRVARDNRDQAPAYQRGAHPTACMWWWSGFFGFPCSFSTLGNSRVGITENLNSAEWSTT